METSDYSFSKDFTVNQVLVGTTIAVSVILIAKYLAVKVSKPYFDQIDFFQKLPNSDHTISEFFAENPEQCLTDLCKNYPSGCFLDLNKSSSFWKAFKKSTNSNKILLLNSMKSIKEFSEHDVIADRPRTLIFDLLSHHYLGSYFRMHDSKLDEIRLTESSGLTNFVLINSKADDLICKEIENFISFLNQSFFGTHSVIYSKEITNPMKHIQNLVINIVMVACFKSRFEYTNESASEIQRHIETMTHLFSDLNILDILGKERLDEEKIKSIKTAIDSIYVYVSKIIGQFKAHYDENNNYETLTEMLISKQKEKLDEKLKVSVDDPYSDNDISAQVFAIFMETCVTSGFTVSWAIYYLANNSEIQSKINQEIKDNISESHFVTSKEEDSMNYTNAFIKELLRLASPMSLIPRSTTKVVNLHGITIPKHTNVLLNVYGIHHDTENWPEPMECKPERWLNEPSTDNYLPFGVHPRICIGEKIINRIIFLIITNLVKHFEMYVDDYSLVEELLSKNEGKMGMMRSPCEFKLKLKRRYNL